MRYIYIFVQYFCQILRLSNLPEFFVETLCSCCIGFTTTISFLEISFYTFQKCNWDLFPNRFFGNNAVSCMIAYGVKWRIKMKKSRDTEARFRLDRIPELMTREISIFRTQYKILLTSTHTSSCLCIEF